MNGEMEYAQFSLQEIMRTVRKLDISEVGVLVLMALENCLMQEALDYDDPSLPKRLGCGSKKTLKRHIESLIQKGVVRDIEGGIMARLAEGAINHYLKNSARGKYANSFRKDRQKSDSEFEEAHQNSASGLSLVPRSRIHSVLEQHSIDGDKSGYAHCLDDLIADLKRLSQRRDQLHLADALVNFSEMQRVEGWLNLGLRQERILKKVDEVLLSKKDGTAIHSWGYFDCIMRELVQAKTG